MCNGYKRLLEKPNLHLCFSQILASNNFWQVANNLGSKDKSPLVHLFDGFELVSFVFDLVTLFAEIFSAKSNHDYSLPHYMHDLFTWFSFKN